ncbi:putative CUE domain containing protein [Lyophyllum shimeji]|uniref:CUE domain containing protein n=1 Tax=Lyophyllum shimeji TaxID=47721 RepID=A0A9P3PKX9_LYOSH|nr:putative CUE domain containing protein [Lyophyllum shimeji]
MTDTTVQNAPPASTPSGDTTTTDSASPATNPFSNPGSSPPAANTNVNAPPSNTPTPSPPPTQTPPQALVQVEERPADPRIAALRAMFPDYDDLILQSVLASVNGNQDRAIDTLLGMSDPEYKGEPTPEAPIMSQTELDEQLARRLMLEEQQEQQAAWQAQQDARRPRFQQQPRPPPSAQSQGQGGGDTMAEIQQQLGKFAETGKKTIGNIFSKVKAKIQEIDQPRTGQSSGTQPTWGGASNGYDSALYEQRTYHGQQHQPQPPYHTRPQQQPAYYDPNAQTSYPIHAPSSTPPNIHGYDVTPEPATTPPSAAPPASTTTTPQSDTPRPPSSGATPIDGGKLGLLPKRPVSLLRSQSPPGQPHAAPPPLQSQHSQQSQDDSEDGLEYAENPFDEPKTTTTTMRK